MIIIYLGYDMYMYGDSINMYCGWLRNHKLPAGGWFIPVSTPTTSSGS